VGIEEEERGTQDESLLFDPTFFEPPPAVDAGAHVLSTSTSSSWSSPTFLQVGFESDIAKPQISKAIDRTGGHTLGRRAPRIKIATDEIHERKCNTTNSN
jgi:hypothetical protein